MCTTCDISPSMVAAINRMAEVSHENSKSHGFWEGEERILSLLQGADREDFLNHIIATKLMLITSEASEANDCVRDNDLVTGRLDYRGEGGKPEGLASEFADIVIRVGDVAKWLGIDLGLAIQAKTNYNKNRPYKHGRTI